MRWCFVWVACVAVACTRNTVAPVPVHSLSASSIILNQGQASKTIYIRNTGGAALNWSLQFSDSNLSADVMAGSVHAGDSAAVTISVNLKGVAKDTVVAMQAQFLFPQTFNQTVWISVVNFTETKWRLPGIIIDAVYNRQKDVLLALTNASNNLLVINPETRSIKEVALEFPGTSVSVSRDGSHAVVVRNAALSYIDLNTLTVQKTVGLPSNGYRAVATDTMAYVFPAGSDYRSLVGVNLKNGDQLTSSFSVSSSCLAKLHPSGNYIYAISTQSFGFPIYQLYLQEHAGLYQDNELWYGDHPLGTNFWFSEDGLTFYSSNGNVFSLDNHQISFLNYQSQLTGLPYGINGFEYSSAAQRIYVLPAPNYNDFVPSKKLLRYNLSHQWLGTETLEPFVLTDYGIPAFYQAFGSAVFINSSGTHVCVLEKSNSPWTEAWALQTFDVK